jgi:DNA ligase-1
MLSADASNIDLTTLRWPLLVSPKLDGIRCVIWEGVAYSRNAKPIRNRHVQTWAADYHNLDGELIVGSATDPHCLNITQSGVMSADGEPDFTYHIFDAPERLKPYDFVTSLLHVTDEHTAQDPRFVEVPHTLVDTLAEMLDLEEKYLYQGYEGVMLRHPEKAYKYGRSTLKEGGLMKLKRFQDGEAVVTGLEEGTRNANPLERDELGRAKRTTHKENLVPNGMVGAILVTCPTWGALRVAPGVMTHAERTLFWNYPDAIVGRTIHWRSFGYGVKDKPRFPRFYARKDEE